MKTNIKKAFALIEVIIAVSVMAILGAAFTFVGGNVKERANETAVKATLGKYNSALTQMALEHPEVSRLSDQDKIRSVINDYLDSDLRFSPEEITSSDGSSTVTVYKSLTKDPWGNEYILSSFLPAYIGEFNPITADGDSFKFNGSKAGKGICISIYSPGKTRDYFSAEPEKTPVFQMVLANGKCISNVSYEDKTGLKKEKISVDGTAADAYLSQDGTIARVGNKIVALTEGKIATAS